MSRLILAYDELYKDIREVRTRLFFTGSGTEPVAYNEEMTKQYGGFPNAADFSRLGKTGTTLRQLQWEFRLNYRRDKETLSDIAKYLIFEDARDFMRHKTSNSLNTTSNAEPAFVTGTYPTFTNSRQVEISESLRFNRKVQNTSTDSNTMFDQFFVDNYRRSPYGIYYKRLILPFANGDARFDFESLSLDIAILDTLISTLQQEEDMYTGISRIWICTGKDPGMNPDSIRITPNSRQIKFYEYSRDIAVPIPSYAKPEFNVDIQYNCIDVSTAEYLYQASKRPYMVIFTEDFSPYAAFLSSSSIDIELSNVEIKRIKRDQEMYSARIRGVWRL